MDSLTHIAIGACIGELFLGNRIGKKAMLYGAIAASLPDIDFVASFWLKTPDDLMAHRGFTHSFLFAFLVVAGLAFLFRHRHRLENIPIRTWIIFMGTEILSHLFLDVFNAYGIGWFEPFSHYRYSFNALFVADPFFSVWPGIAALVLLLMPRQGSKRKAWARSGLILCSLYFFYALFNKFKIDNDSRYALLHQHIHYSEYLSTPAPFNNWLWFVTAKVDSGYYSGYRSVFDKTDSINFHFSPRNDSLLKTIRDQEDLGQLLRFSQGFYTATNSENGVVFNVLRFGQMQGWQDPAAPWVFHYYLQDPDANHMVVQRGRFAGWNRKSVSAFIRRIKGER
jgi:inner membrane protein